MIVTTRAGGNRELRYTPQWDSIPTYTQWRGGQSSAGVVVTEERALGLVNVGAVIKFIAETLASLPVCVYRGEDEKKVKAADSWQWRLLYDQPNPDCSAFDFFSDAAGSIEACGNAYIFKLKAPAIRGRDPEVLALYVEDPSLVVVKRDDQGRKIFRVGPPGRQQEYTSAQIIHIRGFTPHGGDLGISPISQYANVMGTALAAQDFQGRYYANDATPSSYLSIPGRMNRPQARELKDIWVSTHGGSVNAGKLGILAEGAELKTPGVPLRDAQFIESQAFSAEQIAKIFLGPAASLFAKDDDVPNKTEEETLRFLNFALRPRLRRIEAALGADPDLFPEAMTNGELYPQFYLEEFLRSDQATRAQVYHSFIQDGVLLVDEVRAEMGLPPLPEGMGQVPQITPVGGAPNQPALNPPPPEE